MHDEVEVCALLELDGNTARWSIGLHADDGVGGHIGHDHGIRISLTFDGPSPITIEVQGSEPHGSDAYRKGKHSLGSRLDC